LEQAPGGAGTGTGTSGIHPGNRVRESRRSTASLWGEND
jgi:hypothetical protein